MPVDYYVAWWNVENLFDEENAPPDRRSDKVFRAIKNDIAGGLRQLRDRKVAQLASVIAQMNGGAGPDLLGVCEVENRFVLELLVAAVRSVAAGTGYGVAHADTEDARGIDVAFLYDSDHAAGSAGRDVLPCGDAPQRDPGDRPGQLPHAAGGRTWAVFGNHWPSRSGGQFESAGYRHIAGETSAISTNGC